MQTTVVWQGDVAFEAMSGTGHKVMMDGPEDKGGKNRGCRPMEMLLMGMGGCASFDVVHILQKSRQNVKGCRAEITAERADDIPSVFTKIHIKFFVEGDESLKEPHVKRAVELSADKYCSASIMLGKTAEITHDYEIIRS